MSHQEKSREDLINELNDLQRKFDNLKISYEKETTEKMKLENELLLSKKQAEDYNRLKSAFLSCLMHEIRAPMSGIIGFMGLFKDNCGEVSEYPIYIDIITKNAHRVLDTLEDFMEIFKIETGKATVSIAEANINTKIVSLYKQIKPFADEKGVELLYKNGLPTKDANIKTDFEKVNIIFLYLINTAIEFAKEGFIAFGYGKNGKDLNFYVKLSGSSLPDYLMENISGINSPENGHIKFFNGSPGARLSIAKAYIEMLGGKIWVENEEGKGTVFNFTIPTPVIK